MPRPNRPSRLTTVAETIQLTPHMIRIVVEGPSLEGFAVGEFTDHYVKCRFGEGTRSYTVRDWDAERLRLTLDFVVHGDEGIAGPWAAAARPGDTLELTGPGGGYSPSADADWHLLAGDEAVIPAIAVSLERISPGVPVFVIVEVGGPEDEQPLTSSGDLNLQWLHRTGGPGEDPDLQLQAVRALELPEGRGQAFVHGEAEAVLRVRRHLLQERGIDRDDVSATGYWKLRCTDEQWRAEKRAWIAQADADVAGYAP
ncbi:MAG TPA: siderophore-interacting protein [Solirubrobacteraceae bacterium]|nr:siderophore-interacting protein [Solirubrobacteraceae bacterium]